MTLTVSINYTKDGVTQPTRTLSVRDGAQEAVRLDFNPSANERVTRLKALAAAFLSECDDIASEQPNAGRELAVAKTNMQTASMWAVLGATTPAK